MSEKEIKNQKENGITEQTANASEGTEETVIVKDSWGVRIWKWTKRTTKKIVKNRAVRATAWFATAIGGAYVMNKLGNKPEYQLLDESTEEKLVEGIEPTEE